MTIFLRCLYLTLFIWPGTAIPLSQLAAQGCSDSGICTISSLKPDAGRPASEHSNIFRVGLSTGAADHSITVIGGYLSYAQKIGRDVSLESKVTYQAQNGNDISVSGLGDVFINLTYHPSLNVSFTVGTKIPLMKADKNLEGLPLPMDYQASLGTFDLILGSTLHLNRWQFALALQQALRQNENSFLPSLYSIGSPLRDFQGTNGYDRNGDVMLRISYPLPVNEKLTIIPGLLPIYHLGDGHYTDMDGIVQSIPGSKGLTVNGTMYVDLALGSSNTLQFHIGFPFVVRDSRPDGLTRSFVVGAEFARSF